MKMSLSNRANLQGLKTVLNYQLSAGMLMLFTYILGPLIVTIKPYFILLIIIVSILFIPYMLFVLSNARKYGWIFFFCLIVLLPLLTTFILMNNSNLYYAILLVLFGVFFFYCFLLRFAVNDWVNENNRKTQRLRERLDDEMNRNIF